MDERHTARVTQRQVPAVPPSCLAVVDCLPDAAVLYDATGALVHANPAGLARLGAAGVQGGPVGCAPPPEQLAAVLALQGEGVECSLQPLHLDGAPYLLLLVRGDPRPDGEHLRSPVVHDRATGLGNRVLLEDRLSSLLARREGERVGVAVLFVDLDGVAGVQAAYGHAVGDKVLRTVARRLRDAVRPADVVVRWGGEEFVVLLEGSDAAEEAVRVAQRVEQAVVSPIEHRGHALRLTAHVGVALAPPGERHLPSALLQQADAAMHEARAQVGECGSGPSAVYDRALRDTATRRLHVEALLRDAIDGERLVVHYQPLVDLRDRSVVGVEALLRLRDDDGLLHPDDFLDLAEETGVMRRLEHAVLREACRQTSAWVAAGHDVTLNVNVCAQQVTHVDDFEEQVHRALAAAGLPPERLVCEVTEHALLDVGERTVAGLRRLRDAGVTFSVDDFGTGYGSMTYLQELPVGEVKLDRRFVARTGHDRAAAAIVRAVAGLAAELGMRCVAEGVEDELHHAQVRSLGAGLGQGFLYARPGSAESVSRLLEGRP